MHVGFYDSEHKTHRDALYNMNRVLAKVSRINSNDRVLDAGCGYGGSCLWLAKNTGAQVTGIDVVPTHIVESRELLETEGFGATTRFVVGDFADTGLPAESFDVVWGIEACCHTDDKRGFLLESRRLLKQEGRLVIADGFLARPFRSVSEQVAMAKWLKGWVVPNLAAMEVFEGWLDELGFHNVRVFDVTANVVPSSRRVFVASLWGIPVEVILELSHITTRVQTNNILSAFFQHVALRRGLWRYCIFYAEK